MKFTKLLLEQFLAITKAEINLADRGLMLIQGINEDDSSAESNGAGKSSLADGLCWVLYGETARGVSGDAVINDKAGKGTMGQVDIDDGDDVYRIARHRKHPKHKNSLTVMHLAKDGTINELTKGTDKLTQEVVNRIVGASLEVFRAAVYAGQELMPDLPAMTDKQLKVLIEEASGVTLLEEAYRLARDKLSAAKAAHSEVTDQTDKAGMRKDMLEDQVITTTAQRDGWEIDRKTKIATLKAEVGIRVGTVKDIDADIAAIDEPAIAKGLADCDAKLASLSGEQKTHNDLARKVTTAQGEITNHRRFAEAYKREHEQIRDQIAALDATVGTPCHECGREHDRDTIAVHKAALVKKAGELAERFKESKDKMKQATEDAQKLEGELHAFAASMTDPSAINAERASLLGQQRALDDLKRKREVEAVQAKNLANQAKELTAAVNPHLATLTDLEAKIAKIDAELGVLAGKLKEEAGKVEIAESVVKVFSPAGVRAHILDEVTPFLNAQTSKYLSIMSDDNIEAVWTTLVPNSKGELKEKFSIEVTNAKGAKSFGGLSGGEKRKVRICTALALQDLVATRATKPIDLFIGDEIDNALDPAGIERLTQILEDKARERGSVFVISHSDLKDWVSQVITVKKKDGETTLLEEIA
jgi:DNA repair exonuclease SbcCD ATPase subunit